MLEATQPCEYPQYLKPLTMSSPDLHYHSRKFLPFTADSPSSPPFKPALFSDSGYTSDGLAKSTRSMSITGLSESSAPLQTYTNP